MPVQQRTGEYEAPPEGEAQFVIQGHDASSYEYYFAMALEYFGLPYMYQYEFFGGTGILGGIVLDFLVLTEPLSTPVYINGEWAHAGERRETDKLQQVTLMGYYGQSLAPVKEYWGQDVGTPEDALRTVRRDLA